MNLMKNLKYMTDKKGLEFLKGQIEKLLENRTTYAHLMTPNWGGCELSEEKQGENNKLINHVKIYYIGNENRQNTKNKLYL